MSAESSWFTPGTLVTGGVALAAGLWAIVARWFSLVRRDELAAALEDSWDKLDKRLDKTDDAIETSRVEGAQSRALVYARLGAVETHVAVIQSQLKKRAR